MRIILLKIVVLVLQTSKKAKIRVDLNGQWVGAKNGKVSLFGIQTRNTWAAAQHIFNVQSCWGHDFMPDLKVDRFMPIIIEHTALIFYRRRTTLFIRTKANLWTYLSSLTISLKSPFFTFAYFIEIQMPFLESAFKVLSHIQSTLKNIFLRSP